MQKRWQPPADSVELKDHASLTQALLRLRGIAEGDDEARFLAPSWNEGIHDPSLFAQMPQAVERIYRAIEQKERITVHGDYDADGVTGSAVLITALREIENLVGAGSPSLIDAYIPHRDAEGYGLHPETVEILRERGTSLIITVDCGIACVDEIALAKERGIDTIVVDHHQFGDELPAGILIHPKLPGETYPFPHLAAVGVAWKLATALLNEGRKRGLAIPEGWEKWLLDFVSIATVTDMVSLTGENRVLETYGLKVLNKTRRPGLQALIRLAGYELGTLTTESVGFGLGPRINAAGRMDRAMVALELMLAESLEEAAMLAERLEGLNRDRQKVTRRMMGEAETQFAQSEAANVVILYSEEWSPSLVGLVAGKYVEKTGKPTIAIGRHGDRWVGSGRSTASYDITEAVKRAGEGILTHAGGHVQACGFSFPVDASKETLFERLRADAATRLSPEDLIPLLPIDAEIALSLIDWKFLDVLRLLEPYGEGNKRPAFLTRNAQIVSADRMGKELHHVRLVLRSESGPAMKFVGFNFGDRIDELQVGTQVDVVYQVGLNEWNGRRDIQCSLMDVRSAEELGKE